MPKAKIKTEVAEQQKKLEGNDVSLLMDFYATKKAIEEMTKDLALKKEKIIEFLKSQPGMRFSIGEGDNGIGFSLRSTPIYQFSESVGKLEENAKLISEKIKEIKKSEIESGVAKTIDTQFSVWTK